MNDVAQTDIALTFGKHKGTPLSQCPHSYIQWLSEQATVCGKKDIPQAAKALLASLPQEAPAPLRYTVTTLEDAEKLAWMVQKWNNREAKRTLLTLRDEKTRCIMVDVEDGDMGYFKVHDNGTGHFVGRFEDIAEEEKEEQEQAARLAQWKANPTLDWLASNGKRIQVWAKDEFGDMDGYEDDNDVWHDLFIISIDGKKQSWQIDEVPAKSKAWAKANGVVACLGPVGLTQERIQTLLAASKERQIAGRQEEDNFPDVCPRCHQASCNGSDCK